jgi:ADP-ribose pyrophosphatase YjhB (NUDIX family)
MAWLSPSGRALSDYPRPSVAVDVALLTLDDEGRLAVLLYERQEEYETGRWSLPGTFLREHERLREAALRALRDKVGVSGEEPRQLRVFDRPDRDDRGWVISVAHVDLVPRDRLGTRPWLAPVEGDPPRAVLPEGHRGLAFDHDDIVVVAVEWARQLYAQAPDPRQLIGPEFTLLDLQRLHEAVRGGPLLKDAFRRRMLPMLEETGRLRRGTVGKPARIFRSRSRYPEAAR